MKQEYALALKYGFCERIANQSSIYIYRPRASSLIASISLAKANNVSLTSKKHVVLELDRKITYIYLIYNQK